MKLLGILLIAYAFFSPPSFSPAQAREARLADSNSTPTPATGIISIVAGGNDSGFSGDGGLATSAQLNWPNSEAIDVSGNTYIADTDNSAIRRVDAVTHDISTFAGTGGKSGYSGDYGLASLALLNHPQGVAFDASGSNLYIADSGNCVIRKVDMVTSTITTVAGQGPSGPYTTSTCLFGGDGGAALSANLNNPEGVALDSAGNLYIADTSNQSVRRVDAKTGAIATIAGMCGSDIYYCEPGYSGDGGKAVDAQLDQPAAIAFDASQALYIADRYNNRIRRVDADTSVITTVAGSCKLNGTEVCPTGYTPDGELATDALLNEPQGVAIDPLGNIIFSDSFNNLVRKVDAKTGILTTIAGLYPYAGIYRNGGAATNAALQQPTQLAFDRAGNLYIADNADQAIREVTGSNQPTALPPAISPPGQAFYNSLSVSITDASSDAIIYYTLDGSVPTTGSPVYSNPVEVSQSSTVTAFATSPGLANGPAAAQTYTYETPTPAPTLSPPGGTFTAVTPVALADALPATFYFTLDGSTPTTNSSSSGGQVILNASATLNVIAVADGYLPSPVVSGVYTLNLPVLPAPAFSPRPGTYVGTQTIGIIDSNTSADIYYTTDGSAPATSNQGQRYWGPFTITGTTTVKAVASLNGYNNSPVISAPYVIDIPAPKFSPAAGTYKRSQTVTLTESDSSAVIEYALEGATPGTAAFVRYTGPFTIGETTTLAAKAQHKGAVSSKTVTARYIIEKAPAVTTSAATDVGSRSAALNGTIGPEYASTAWWFVYGESPKALTQKTAVHTLAGQPGRDKVIAGVTGLVPKTRYYFQLVARNVVGTKSGAALTFMTP